MKCHKLTPLIFILGIVHCKVHSQVGGVSASKLNAYSASPIEKGKIEFEPSFIIAVTPNTEVDDPEMTTSSRSYQYSSGMNFRMTYGLHKRIEVGAIVDGSITSASFGTKLQFIENKIWQAAFITGANLNGLKEIHNGSDNMEIAHSYSAGIVNSFYIKPRLSFDADLQVNKYFSRELSSVTGLFINGDLGYYVFEHFQLITGVNYYSYTGPDVSSEMMIETGFTAEAARQFILMFRIPISIYTRNSQPSYGFAIGLNMTFD